MVCFVWVVIFLGERLVVMVWLRWVRNFLWVCVIDMRLLNLLILGVFIEMMGCFMVRYLCSLMGLVCSICCVSWYGMIVVVNVLL